MTLRIFAVRTISCSKAHGLFVNKVCIPHPMFVITAQGLLIIHFGTVVIDSDKK